MHMRCKYRLNMTITWTDNPKQETDCLHKPHRPLHSESKHAFGRSQKQLQFVLYQPSPTGIIAALRATRPVVPPHDTDTQQTDLLLSPAYTRHNALQYRYAPHFGQRRIAYTVIPRLAKIIRSGITFVSRNVISRRFL